MRLLLDTHIFLWLITNDARLSQQAQRAIADPSNDVYLSAVSFWEISVKHQLGKLSLPQPPAVIIPEARVRHENEDLSLEERDIQQLDQLPSLHRDPFDRMLLCQAIARGLTLVTADPVVMRYQAVRFLQETVRWQGGQTTDRLVTRIVTAERDVQIQSPVVCGIDQMPEPDFAIIRGNDDAYTDRLPSGADVLCVVEVADSSLERDRDEKGPIYARAGVPQYVILNLWNRTAEVYAEPDLTAGAYQSHEVVAEDGSVLFRVGEAERVAQNLADLLP